MSNHVAEFSMSIMNNREFVEEFESSKHWCTYSQEECARILLFRGAAKDVANYSSVDAQFLAAKVGNERLAELIKNFPPKDVGKYYCSTVP
jgi:hypothetical protein